MFSWNPARIAQGSDESGFTLVEFLVVSLILFVLAALSLPIIAGSTEKARVARSATELRTIEQALDLYYEERGYYPDSLGGLVKDGYLKQTSFESPWSTPDNRVLFFYAVDQKGKAKAYALGDPGVTRPDCSDDKLKCPSSRSKIQQITLSWEPSTQLPCGCPANQAYVTTGAKPNLVLSPKDGLPIVVIPPDFRSDLRTQW